MIYNKRKQQQKRKKKKRKANEELYEGFGFPQHDPFLGLTQRTFNQEEFKKSDFSKKGVTYPEYLQEKTLKDTEERGELYSTITNVIAPFVRSFKK